MKLMTFSEALDAMKLGHRVAREGWNGKGMFVWINPGSYPNDGRDQSHVNGVSFEFFERGDKDTSVRMPCFNMRAADGSTVVGWLASQTDMLAEDWVLA